MGEAGWFGQPDGGVFVDCYIKDHVGHGIALHCYTVLFYGNISRFTVSIGTQG